MGGWMRFKRHSLPIGDDAIPLLIASEGDEPKAVFMSYESFLELTATLYMAIEALKAAEIDLDLLAEDQEPDVSNVRVARAG